jgi:hypothetical protein
MGKVEALLNELGYRLFPSHRDMINAACDEARRYRDLLEESQERLALAVMELESLKKKIVERAQVTPILKAKSSADVRRIMEMENEREEVNNAG